MWIWQQKNWPKFSWIDAKINPLLAKAQALQQALLHRTTWLKGDFLRQAQAEVLVEEAIQTSAIEGELLERASVRLSVARHLGIFQENTTKKDWRAEGLVALLFDASRYKKKLTAQRLFSWHAALFPSGYSSIHLIKVAQYRTEKMYVMSGAMGKQKVHFEAPAPKQLKSEMRQFIDWFNHSENRLNGMLRAGMAHFYFVTIHPFEDGNGRIARALIDLALSQFEQSEIRLYRLSSKIEKHRKAYYLALETAQKSSLDITTYLIWFLETLIASLQRAEKIIQKVLDKAQFWQHHCLTDLNPRQKKALNFLLDLGDDFVGHLNTRKYASLNHISRATAYRELNDLVEKACLRVSAQGRSTHYILNTSV